MYMTIFSIAISCDARVVLCDTMQRHPVSALSHSDDRLRFGGEFRLLEAARERFQFLCSTANRP